MDDRPVVSVVVTTYNYGKYVRGAVDSVLGQTHGNLDVLVIDDGSTDDTRRILAEYVQAGRIRYLHQDNAGQARAKNRRLRPVNETYRYTQKARHKELGRRRNRNRMRATLKLFKGDEPSTSPYCTWINEPFEPEELPPNWEPPPPPPPDPDDPPF